MNEALKELVTKLYEETGITIEPTFPRLLVRLLPREQKTKAGLWLPDAAQNKPVHEGIVLATYKPFWRKVWESTQAYKVITADTLLDEDGAVDKIWQEPGVKVGDHVTFPHMALGITPVWPLDDGVGDYRLVPEGEIHGVLTYHKEPVSEWLESILSGAAGNDAADANALARYILSKADVVRRPLASMTVSGK